MLVAESLAFCSSSRQHEMHSRNKYVESGATNVRIHRYLLAISVLKISANLCSSASTLLLQSIYVFSIKEKFCGKDFKVVKML